MDDVQARLNLVEDLGKIQDQIALSRWLIEPWPLTAPEFLVTITSAIDSQAYTLRIVGSRYPNEPPSIACVNHETRNPRDPKAWPKCEGFRPNEADLCLPISMEGFRTHPEWRNSEHAWTPTGNPIWCVLSTIQDLFNNAARYHGRNC